MATTSTAVKKTAAKAAPEPDIAPNEDVENAEKELTEEPGDATPEELEAVALHGVSLTTLRAIRAQANADVDAAVTAAGPVPGYDPHAGICGACHPAGWPDPGADYSECEHGVYTRHGYEKKAEAAA